MLRHTTNNLKTGQLAERSGVSLQTIRYYELEGLLPKPQRLSSGYRMFSPNTVWQIQFIKRAQKLGFSLADIRELLSIPAYGGRNGDSSTVASRSEGPGRTTIKSRQAALTLAVLAIACTSGASFQLCNSPCRQRLAWYPECQNLQGEQKW
jgi:DNA-binding transcriptional MerR regulator